MTKELDDALRAAGTFVGHPEVCRELAAELLEWMANGIDQAACAGYAQPTNSLRVKQLRTEAQKLREGK